MKVVKGKGGKVISHIKNPDEIKLYIRKWVKITPEGKKCLPPQLQHLTERAQNIGVMRVPKESINTRRKLAHFMARNYGYGRFIISFWNYGKRNKNFSKNFVCRLKRGKPCWYKDNGKCRVYSRHQKGWQCKANRKHKPQSEKRAEIEIIPKKPTRIMNDGLPDDYAYDWTYDQLWRMKFIKKH